MKSSATQPRVNSASPRSFFQAAPESMEWVASSIAASGLPRSYRSASAVIMFPYIILQFISGVYVPFTSVPRWLQQIAAIFPLKWMSEGLRSVFLPGRAAVLEPAGTWEHGRIALVLIAWIAGGLVLCLTTFRWRSRRDG